ncbi:MAG: peptide chain release factor N(5)-glutamine methyltransferase [Deltaproteobacteria bacterium]|nr:peptide chain release factor N(5)-glutamine methyltransferase [Deltaproteobacteria bacterium]
MRRKSWTIKGLLEVTSNYLREKGVDNPRLSAEVLLAFHLRIDRVGLYLNLDQPLHEREVTAYRELIKRRLNREPIQYMTGIQEFWSLDFAVGPQVLIPRPETELLVEQVLSLRDEERLTKSENLRILDLGTGCGVLAVTLARELEGASVWASDVSAEALAIAKINAKKHGVEEKIEFLLSDMWKGLIDSSLVFDVIVSNPPYIASDHISLLAPEVRDHEPRSALDGGEQGMRFIKEIIKEAPKYLNAGGWILLEMDPEQTVISMELMDKNNDYIEKRRIKDYSGHYRVVMARKCGL